MLMMYFFYIYFFVFLTVLFHELGHLFVALIFNFKNIEFSIGEELFQVKFKKFKVSPFVYKGYVAFDITKNVTKKQLLCFYFASIYYQIILQALFLLYFNIGKELLVSTCVNVAYIIISLIPLFNSDLKMYLKNKKQLSNKSY